MRGYLLSRPLAAGDVPYRLGEVPTCAVLFPAVLEQLQV